VTELAARRSSSSSRSRSRGSCYFLEEFAESEVHVAFDFDAGCPSFGIGVLEAPGSGAPHSGLFGRANHDERAYFAFGPPCWEVDVAGPCSKPPASVSLRLTAELIHSRCLAP
jgi:hypothetical protein